LELCTFCICTFLSYVVPHHGLSLKSNRYGIEQEYTLLQKDVSWPLGWPIGGYPGPQARKLQLNNLTMALQLLCVCVSQLNKLRDVGSEYKNPVTI
jgi:hypothetical protein